MSRCAWVPHVLVSHRLHVHQLADAASQGAHAEDPQLSLRGDIPDRLTFGLQHILARRTCTWMPCTHTEVFLFVGTGFTSILMLKPLRVTLPAKPVVSGRVSNWGGSKVIKSFSNKQDLILNWTCEWPYQDRVAGWVNSHGVPLLHG